MYGKGSRTSSAQDKDENLSSESEAEGPGARGRGGDIDDMDLRAGRGEEDDYMSDEGALDEHETAAEKRVRLARGYLEKVRKEVEDGMSTNCMRRATRMVWRGV
jgi:ribosomal RNA-processing protein 9